MFPLVLFVDDDPLIIRSFTRLCRKKPVRVVTATSAEQARALLEVHRPRAVISDYQLPGIDGFSFLCEVRRRHPAMLLVLHTGSTFVPPASSGIERLDKPFAEETLDALFERLGDGRRLWQLSDS